MGKIFYKSYADRYSYGHNIVVKPGNKCYRYHSNHNEVFVMIQGNCRFAVEDNSYMLKPYDVIVIQSAEQHRLYHLEPITKYENYVCHIPDSFFIRNGCEEMKEVFSARPLGVNNLISGDLIKDSYVMDIFEKMDEYVTRYDPVSENVMRCKLIELLFHLNQLHKQSLTETIVNEDIRNIILYINEKICENIDEKISLEDVAKNFFMSKSHVCHLFKKYMGITVNQYINQKRFIRVRELCADGVSLTDACLRAGFGTYSNFYKMYLKEMGRTPSEDFY